MSGLRKTPKSDHFPTEEQIKRLVSAANEELINEAHVLTGEIQEKFYSGQSNHSLGRRTGQAARGWQVKQNKETVSIVNNVPHADHSRARTIRPTKSKYLAIPVGKALTPAGVARYSGPRDSALPELSIAPIKNKDGYILFDKSGNQKRISNIYFVLKKEVRLPARTRLLTPYVSAYGKEISKRLGKFIFDGWDQIAEGIKK